LDTLDRRGTGYGYYSSYGFYKHHDHHHYHPYRRNDKEYLSNEFKKEKPPTFDGEMKKSKDVEACFLGMRKFLRLHDYSENMKAKITLFSLKGKATLSERFLK